LHYQNKFRKLIYFLKEIYLIKKFINKFYVVNLYDGINSQFERNPSIEIYEKLFNVISKIQESKKTNVIKKIILVNNGLAAGGAEKQIVNTLIGLERSGQFREIGLLCEYIGMSKDLDFFLNDLKDTSVNIYKLEKKYLISDNGLASVSPPIAQILKSFPMSLIEDILNMVYFFKTTKPDLVHAWQDITSIKVAIAASIAGIDKIVISGRNMSPINFKYYQNYMEPIYKTLAKNERIKFVNNSFAGASDYSKWLDINPEIIKVLRNGIIFDTDSTKVDIKKIEKYKESLNIPDKKLIIGSIFRFWEEKDPFLFLNVAKILLKRNKNIHFLIIGDGPLRGEMEEFINDNSFGNFFTMPGTTNDITLPMKSFDIFLLTSLFEGTPNVLIEAQLFGLPVVSTDAGGSKETFAINETGFCAKSRDPFELADLVQIFIDNDDLRNKINKIAPEVVQNKFNFNKMIEKTIDLYKSFS